MEAPKRIWTASTNGKCHVGFDTPSMNYTNEWISADLIDKDVLRQAEAIVDKVAAAWFVAMQNNRANHMTLGEIGALAKHHLDVSAMKEAEKVLTALHKMMENLE